MTFDMFEAGGLDTVKFDLQGKMTALRSGFESSLESKYDAFMNMPDSVDGNAAHWLGIDTADAAADLAALRTEVMSSAQQMYNGITYEDGFKTLGLKDIGDWKVNKDYKAQNIKQHSGYAAEVIGTTKENLIAEKNGTGVKTYRADDRPDLFQKNDQYVDKIRVDSNGNMERIQVKFVGKDASECLSKLASKDFDKYFNDGKVDKMEIPKDYYDGMKSLIPDKISDLEKQ